MARKSSKTKANKKIETLQHKEATRKNIPTAEYQSVMRKEDQTPLKKAYERRNRDLDPQLVWRGKDVQDWSDLVVPVPPVYIQEKVHPKVLIDDLKNHSVNGQESESEQVDLFSDFNGLSDDATKTEFYQHDANWSNRLILGDSLQVMASLAEREGLRGKVQCIYLDPPYGIKFNSNFQWSTTDRSVTDGKMEQITREPEQVKAFRDTWRDGIHSYLTYLRDRLTVARDLLADSGSIFVQIGDENVHRIKSLMDELFGEANSCAIISFSKTTGLGSKLLPTSIDFLLWYAKKKDVAKYRQPLKEKTLGGEGVSTYQFIRTSFGQDRRITQKEKSKLSIIDSKPLIYRLSDLRSQSGGKTTSFSYNFRGKIFKPGKGYWKSNKEGFNRLNKAYRLKVSGKSIAYRRYISDYPAFAISNSWEDTGTGSFTDPKIYVVQTGVKTVQRCILMTSDPGDLVLDPTCGSGTTAYVAEQWGRRWITIDTSRVALTLARARIMGARYPYYLLADSPEGQKKSAEISKTAPSDESTYGDIRQGFVYERVPHITLKSIANNAEIDVIWEKYQETLEPLREKLNKTLKKSWEEWEIPRGAKDNWPQEAKKVHKQWWDNRIARQKEIDASIAAKADYEYLYDKPYEDKKTVRVAGPFTVESLSPHRVLAVDENDDLIDPRESFSLKTADETDFASMILDNLKRAGVQQVHKEDKINFQAITPWPGIYICAEGRYVEGDRKAGKEKRVAIFIGPEFGTVNRPDLVAAAKEAGDADFDVLITCAFSYDAQSTDFSKLGRIPVLKARMNADLHMSDELKNTGKGNLFVIFGEPDIKILDTEDDQIQVKINGVDVFDPTTGKVRSNSADGIACWFIDTDYNEESFFVRHAYFLGTSDPYKALKTSLKAEINKDAWETLYSDTSRPFDKPKSGRIAVKVINHLGDEVMKVFRVE